MIRNRCQLLFAAAVVLVLSGGVVLAQKDAPGTPQITRAPAVATPADNGSVMYSTYCAVCHGATGRGDGPAAAALKKNPADLTELSRNNGGKFPEVRFRDVVSLNALVIEHGSTEMPMWGRIFLQMPGGNATAALRVMNLMNYVKTLQQ